MTPLGAIIRAEISDTGPMRLDRYMTLCLSHPEHGYYTTRDPFGAAGDFVTAPEISQMFGEIIGLWLAQSWHDQGAPSPFTLAELGPGRGTLMADILRSASMVPGFGDAADITMLETSPVLRAACERSLAGSTISWIDDLTQMPGQPAFLIANEFFDALPVRQFQKIDDQWAERFVDIDQTDLAFRIAPVRGDIPLACNPALPDGAVVEVSALGESIASQIAQVLKTRGGAALIVDYGEWHGGGDTLQAVRGHKSVSALDDPGTADLTTHVAFDRLAHAAAGVATAMTAQGAFLERLGITARANQLAATAPDAQGDAIVAAHRRLTHPDEMGNLFKALALTPTNAPAPAGFEP